MPSFGGLTKFFGRTASEGAAFAAGLAVSPALSPVVREVVNEANAKYSTHPLSPGDAAAIVAEDVDSLGWGETEASFNGVSPGRFDRLWREVQSAPGVGELFEAYRRDLIDDAAFTHGLRKAKLEPMWDAPLKALKSQRLGPDVIARAIQRGLVRDPGILPVGPPTGVGNVPAFPVFDLDPLAEARAFGIDRDRLGVEVGLVGNPMGPHEAAQAEFRGILTDDDYRRAIAEGNTRNEWADAIREQSRQIPTSHTYVEGHLRGWLNDAEMNAGTARHGMTAEDTRLEFLVSGRPPSWHQVWIGLQRGGVYDGPTEMIAPPFLKSLQESNLRPEWYNLLWHSRYSYPSAFVLRGLAQSGDLTHDETLEILHFEGWEPTLAAKVAARWTEASPTKQDPAIKTAETKFLTALHKAFVGGAITDAQGVSEIALTSLSAEAQAGVLDYWRKEKALEAIPPPPP